MGSSRSKRRPPSSTKSTSTRPTTRPPPRPPSSPKTPSSNKPSTRQTPPPPRTPSLQVPTLPKKNLRSQASRPKPLFLLPQPPLPQPAIFLLLLPLCDANDHRVSDGSEPPHANDHRVSDGSEPKAASECLPGPDEHKSMH